MEAVDLLGKEIERLDAEILALINQRLGAAKEIGELITASGNRLPDRTREDEMIRRLSALNQGPLSNASLHHIFYEIMASAIEIQRRQRIAYLGPEATFTHIAALKQFGRAPVFTPQPSVRDIFCEVEKRACDYGVVPVENSIEGSVNHTLDLLFESELRICGEVYLPISHDLLSRTADLQRIRVIYSHPQAFAQCREWLRKYMPGCRLEECSSTAYAAQKAVHDPEAAAIASNEAARIYDLRVAASRIEDFSRNVTRFLVIGREVCEPTGNDKTSIIFATAHIPGALYRVLQPMAAAGINMLKLESRPSKHENWNYCFYVDIEGHTADPNVRETLSSMKTLCQRIKHLGSYPRARND